MPLPTRSAAAPRAGATRPASAATGGPAGRLFRLEFPAGSRLGRLCAPAAGPLERLLGLDRLNDVYRRAAGAPDVGEFLRRVIEAIEIRYRLPQADLDRIPRTGPLLVVANHPFGALDGILLAAVLRSVRPDVKVMANYLLHRIPDLRDLFLFVDPFGGASATSSNAGPLRHSLRWLKEGHVLAAFPAGEVAPLTLRDRQVTDSPWNDTVARLVRKTGVPVLPVYFDGCNGPLFQALGLIHPRVRTALLPRELFRRGRSCVEMRVGSVIAPKRLASIDTDAGVTDYLRRRTFLLQHGRPRGYITVRAPAPQAGEEWASVTRPQGRRSLPAQPRISSVRTAGSGAAPRLGGSAAGAARDRAPRYRTWAFTTAPW